jgi:hypothetical protein
LGQMPADLVAYVMGYLLWANLENAITLIFHDSCP